MPSTSRGAIPSSVAIARDGKANINASSGVVRRSGSTEAIAATLMRTMREKSSPSGVPCIIFGTGSRAGRTPNASFESMASTAAALAATEQPISAS